MYIHFAFQLRPAGKPCLRRFIPSLRYRTVNWPYNRENFLPLRAPDILVKSRQSLPIGTHSGQERVSRVPPRNDDGARLIDVKAGGHALTRNAARMRDRADRARARAHTRRSCAHTRPNAAPHRSVRTGTGPLVALVFLPRNTIRLPSVINAAREIDRCSPREIRR